MGRIRPALSKLRLITYLIALFLDLNGSPVLLSGPRNDHEVAAWHVVLSLHDLSDRADGVDNGGARLVRRECLQQLEGTTAIGILGEREHVGMHGLPPRDP